MGGESGPGGSSVVISGAWFRATARQRSPSVRRSLTPVLTIPMRSKSSGPYPSIREVRATRMTTPCAMTTIVWPG